MAKNLKENLTIIKVNQKDKIYCTEPYAQELYDLMNRIPVQVKDIQTGELLHAIDLKVAASGQVEIYTSGGAFLYLDMRKDKKYFEAIGFSDLDMTKLDELSKAGWFRNLFAEREEMIIVEGDINEMRGSIYEAYLGKTRDEFMSQISSQTAYYHAKVISKNQGGFFVKVQGVDAFLPGSLAAANKIVDFDTYIGREIPVMVEDYLKNSDTFIFSYKKYLDKILPAKLAEIERFSKLEGIITGASKYGIFVEFQEMFTGLLHTSEMENATLDNFVNRRVEAGQTIEIWVKDIKDSKLILTEFNPAEKQEEIENFKTKSEGTVKSMKVVSIKPFGVFFEVEEDRIGLLPIREMKKLARKMEVGESYPLCITKVDSDSGKIYLSALNEKVANEI
jgi:predicted RNA-binding protein with RPS1 domain